MREISAKDKAIWLSDTAHKTYQLTIGDTVLGNADIVEESIRLEEVAEDAEQLEFSGCHAKVLKLNLTYINESAFGLPVELKAKAELGDDETDWLTLFTGKVTALTQNSANDILSSLTAHDALQEVNNIDLAEWYKTLSFPITLRAFRASLGAELARYGVTLQDEELPLDAMTIDETIAPDTLAGRDVLINIAAINAHYCVCDAENVIRFIGLERPVVTGFYPSEDIFPSDDLFPDDISDNAAEMIPSAEISDLNYRNYDVEPIDKVVLREDEDDIGAIYGDGTNAYIVEGNFLLFGKSAEDLAAVAEQVYGLVEGFLFTPALITGKARPWLEMGDLVRVDTAQNILLTYVLQKSFNGLQNINGSYGGIFKKDRQKQLSSINTQLIQLRGKSNKLVRDVEHTSSAIFDANGNSRIEQNARAIDLKVSVGDVSSQLSLEEGKIEIKSNRISIASDNFTLTEDGEITATSGTIAGFTVNRQSLVYGSYFELSSAGSGSVLRIGPAGINAFTVNTQGEVVANKIGVGGGGGMVTIDANGISLPGGGSITAALGTIKGNTLEATNSVKGASVEASNTVKGATIEATTALKVGVSSFSSMSLAWVPIYASNGYTVVAYGLSPLSVSRPGKVLGAIT